METLNFNEVAHFQPKQIEAFNTLLSEECKYLLYGGAAAGGKSYFLRWSAIALSIWYYQKYKVKAIPIGLFCEDYPTLKDRQISRIKREIPPRIGQLRESRDEGYVFQLADDLGGGLILLRNLDDPSKYFSTEFAAIFVDELTRNPVNTFEDLRFRLRYPGIRDVKFVAATNPGGVGHGWVKQYWIDKTLEDPEIERFFYIPAKYSDNKFVDETYVKQLESLPLEKRRAYMEGDWNVFAGQFFSEFRDKHTIPFYKPPIDSIIVGGMDWGRTAPFAFELSSIQKISYDGHTFYRAKTFLEVYGTDKTPKDWSIIMKEKIQGVGLKLTDINWIRGDPSMFTKLADMSVSIADQFMENGIRIQPASNDRVGGWENLHQWLSIAPDGLPYWQISLNCPNLIRTLPELVHDDLKVEDVDSDGEDHAPDAIRYQFKHLKRPGAYVGGVLEDKKPLREKFMTAKMDDGRQIGIDPSKFLK